jgi:hypothetical protein
VQGDIRKVESTEALTDTTRKIQVYLTAKTTITVLGSDRAIVSPTFPDLKLTAEHVLRAGR